MEEKKRRNVEDIVNSLRSPAVITDRKILKPNRHFQPVSVFHCSGRQSDYQPPANSVKTSSLLSIIDKSEGNDKDEKILFKNYNFDDVRDSSTQTSKTIIQLARIETGDMSPDSLSPTPRELHEYCSCDIQSTPSNFDNFSLDGSVTEAEQSIQFCRKGSVEQYLVARDSTPLKPPVEPKPACLPVPEMLPVYIDPKDEVPAEEFPKNSLIETFLKKTRSRISNRRCKKLDDSNSGDNAKYLHQRSQVRSDVHVKPKVGAEFKSQSYVEPHHPNYIPDDEEKLQQQFTRFTVKNVQRNSPNTPITYIRSQALQEAPASDRNRRFTPSPEPLGHGSYLVKEKMGNQRVEQGHPSRQRYSPWLYNQNRRSNSFMMPTLASEQKNKLAEVRNIGRLISPTRRGRSSSPKKVTNNIEFFTNEPRKIPYIDQSRCELVSPRPTGVKERKSLIERASSPKALSPVIPATNFQEDMMRIDQLSLTLPSEEGSFAGGIDALSVASSDNALGSILNRIQDEDWNVALKGLADVTEMCRTMDPELMMPHMMIINQRLIELLRSPRSHVCRTACQAAGHLFESMKDTRGPEFNDIVDILLCKTADANKFIRQDANLALDCMVTHVPTFHAVRALCVKGPTHKNHLVRCATVRLIICAVVITGPDVILNANNNEFTRRRIFQNMIKFLEDKNPETRKFGERLYKVLSKGAAFDAYLKRYTDKDELARMKKTLKFLVGKK